jgi:hypothetical protein
MLDRTTARAILQCCGVPLGADFHTLHSNQVESLIAEADRAGYRKPKNANGSRGRYFHAYLTRVAAREEG